MTMFGALKILVDMVNAGIVIALAWVGLEWITGACEPTVDPHPERHAAAVELARHTPWMLEHAREIVDAYHEHYADWDFDRWVNLVMQVGLESAPLLAAQMDAAGFTDAYKIADRYVGAVHVITTDETSEP